MNLATIKTRIARTFGLVTREEFESLRSLVTGSQADLLRSIDNSLSGLEHDVRELETAEVLWPEPEDFVRKGLAAIGDVTEYVDPNAVAGEIDVQDLLCGEDLTDSVDAYAIAREVASNLIVKVEI